MLLQQTGPAVWLEFDFENELAERKDNKKFCCIYFMKSTRTRSIFSNDFTLKTIVYG